MSKLVAVIVRPRCTVGRTACPDSHEGERLKLDADDARRLVESGLVRYDEQKNAPAEGRR
jgi:hypothetical protein